LALAMRRGTCPECVEALERQMQGYLEKEIKLSWREAGPTSHHDDKVDSDQQVVDKELSLVPPKPFPRPERKALRPPQILNPRGIRRSAREKLGFGSRSCLSPARGRSLVCR